jgi:predicted ATPase
MSPKRSMEGPFVGRENALEWLMGELAEMLSSHGGAVLITGDVGIGKTRLAQEFESMARGSGCITLQGACKAGTTTPYLVFINALGPSEEVSSQGKGSDIEGDDRLRDWSRLAVDTVRKAGRQDVPFKVLELLRDLSKERPVMLRLDDLQYAKPECMQLFHFLARNLHEERVLVMGLCRLQDLPPITQGQGGLTNSLQIMRRERVVQEMALGPLDKVETRLLLKEILGQSPDPRLCEPIHEMTEGNPSVIIETVRAGTVSGELVRSRERRESDGPLTLHLPDEVRKVMLERLDDLSYDQRRLLEMASVMGREFAPDLLGETMRSGVEETISMLDEIVHSSHIIEESGTKYRFQSLLQWRVVNDSISRLPDN